MKNFFQGFNWRILVWRSTMISLLQLWSTIWLHPYHRRFTPSLHSSIEFKLVVTKWKSSSRAIKETGSIVLAQVRNNRQRIVRWLALCSVESSHYFFQGYISLCAKSLALTFPLAFIEFSPKNSSMDLTVDVSVPSEEKERTEHCWFPFRLRIFLLALCYRRVIECSIWSKDWTLTNTSTLAKALHRSCHCPMCSKKGTVIH